MSSPSSSLQSSALLFVNKDNTKDVFNRIAITAVCNHTFRVLVHNDVSKETIARDKPYTFDGSMNDIMDYFLDVCAMFRVDMDSNPPNSIDVMVPGYPIISVLIKNKEHPFPEGLVRRVLRSWMTRELHKVAQ